MRNVDVLLVKQFEQTFGIPVIWDAVALTQRNCNGWSKVLFGFLLLKQWSLKKMVDILHATLSNTLSRMKCLDKG